AATRTTRAVPVTPATPDRVATSVRIATPTTAARIHGPGSWTSVRSAHGASVDRSGSPTAGVSRRSAGGGALPTGATDGSRTTMVQPAGWRRSDGRAWGRGPHAPEEAGVGAPAGETTRMAPPCRSTIQRAMARPRPAPPEPLALEASAR